MVLDDPVVDDGDAPASSRRADARCLPSAPRASPSGCGRSRSAPRRLAEAQGRAQGSPVHAADLPHPPQEGEAVLRREAQAPGIVAAVLQPLDPLDEDLGPGVGSGVAENPAHRVTPQKSTSKPLNRPLQGSQSTWTSLTYAPGRSAAQPREQPLQGRRVAFRVHLHAPVGPVCHAAGKAQRARLADGGVSKPDTLHVSRHHGVEGGVSRASRCGHPASTFQAGSSSRILRMSPSSSE